MEKIKAIFFDFDWTLFDHKIRDYDYQTIKAINELKNQGVKLFINSARSYYSLKGLSILDLINFDGFGVSNGSIAMTNNDILYHYDIPNNIAQEIIEVANNNHISYLINTFKDSFIHIYDQEILKRFYSIFYEPFPKDISKYDPKDPINVIQIFTTAENDYLFEKFKQYIVIHRFSDVCIEINFKSFTKDEVVNHFLKYFKLDKNEVACFGDDLNDIDMFKAVKHSICLGNGNDEAKKYAEYVTSNIENKGIINGLKYLELLK